MYSLIITLISIALVAALALATLYYGSDAFNKGDDAATVVKVLNTGQQVAGAFQLATADKATQSIDVLVSMQSLLAEQYLVSVPSVNLIVWREIAQTKGWLLLPSAITKAACLAFNTKVHNLDAIPSSPLLGVSKLCYGNDAKGFSVVWRAVGDRLLSDATSSAAVLGKDAAGDPFEPSDHSPVALGNVVWTTPPTRTPTGELGTAPADTSPPRFTYPELNNDQQALYDQINVYGIVGALPFADDPNAEYMADTFQHYGIRIPKAALPSDWEVDMTTMSAGMVNVVYPEDCPSRMAPASQCKQPSAPNASVHPAIWDSAAQVWRLYGYNNRAPNSGSLMAPGYVNITFIQSSTIGTSHEHRITLPLMMSIANILLT